MESSRDLGGVKVVGEPSSYVRTISLQELVTAFDAQAYALVGNRCEDNLFVKHIALLEEDCRFEGEQYAPVTHVGPPIQESFRFKCHVLGQIDLTSEEVEVIATWVSGMLLRRPESTIKPYQQFTILPHMASMPAELGRPLLQRFSCVGFVLEAYRAANIDLVDTDNLPLATLDEVRRAYPELERILLADSRTQHYYGFDGLERLGLKGDGPWPVLLPGYLFHSMARFKDGDCRRDPMSIEDASYSCYPV